MTQRKNIDIGPIIAMTRSAYRIVKIAPFVYAMIYIMCLLGYRPIPHFSGGCRNC